MTTRESLYTELDVAELLALARYRSELCPKCGGPLAECTAPEKRGPRYRATRIRCQRTDALVIAQAAAEENKVVRPEALVWFTTETGR